MPRERRLIPEMEMSLDDIIKVKKRLAKSLEERQYWRKKVHSKWSQSQTPDVFDAREIIIAKQRSRIFDARDVINRKKMYRNDRRNKNAREQEFGKRFKIRYSSININSVVPENHHESDQMASTYPNKRHSSNGRMRDSELESVVKFSNTYVDYDDMTEKEEDEERMRIFDILNLRKSKEQPVTKSRSKEMNGDAVPKTGQLKFGITVGNRSQFNYKPSAMGTPGFRVLVSNLHRNVTTKDVRELFADIGPLTDANIIRPGTAEIVYNSVEDAQKAVDAYHNREFDGKPMYCVLVAQHNTNRCVLRSGARPTFSSNHPDTVDLDAVHAALFGTR